MSDLAGRPPGPGKTRDRAMVLPLAGFALLMPPLGGAFQLEFKIAGVPFTLVYLFSVWAVLIFCGWRLSRQLGQAQAADAARAVAELLAAMDGGEARSAS